MGFGRLSHPQAANLAPPPNTTDLAPPNFRDMNCNKKAVRCAIAKMTVRCALYECPESFECA